ncbi:hypothetical protein FS749_007542, partial [Ceratobasidium sp. UAMH 11750]
MTNHRPFRRFHHAPQPSLHAVMESDAAGGNVTSPPPSQVLLHPQPVQVQVQQPRVRKSVRSHLPIVGKYFAPGGRYEPSRLRNLNQPQGQGQGQGFRGQAQGQGSFQQGSSLAFPSSADSAYQSSSLAFQASAFQGHDSAFQGQSSLASQPGSSLSQSNTVSQGPSSNPASQGPNSATFQGQATFQGLQYPSFSQAQVPSPSAFSQSGSAFDQSPPQQTQEYIEPDDGVIYEEQEPEPEAYDVGAGPEYSAVYQDGMSQFAGNGAYVQQVSVSLPAHAQMVAALSHGPAPMVQSYERSSQSQASQSYSHLPQSRPPLSTQQHSSQSTAMPALDSAMHSPQPLPPDEPAPPSPQQKVSSGVPMPLTMSLPTTGAHSPGPLMSRTITHHAYDDADADVKVPVKEVSPGPGVGVGGGRKSRWPSFSV